MFLKTDSSNVSFREYFYEGNLLLKPIIFLIACVSKFLRVRIPGSPDVPAVEQLAAFETTFEELPADLLTNLIPEIELLSEQGFQVCKVYAINDVNHNTRYSSVVLVSANQETVAWVRERIWPQLPRSSRFVRTMLYSEGVDGRKVLTTNAKRDLLDPPDWQMDYKPRLAIGQLLSVHQNRVASQIGNARPRDWDNEEAAEAIERLQAEFVSHQKSRGVFREPTEREQALAQELQQDTNDSNDEMLPVIAAVRRIEQKQTQWFVKLLMLLLSVAFFIGLGVGSWGWEVVLLLVPILFIHEMGHFIAMKLFGYKNTQMFFIPFLGAAVTGRKLNVPGWKKAMVSLAGPVPSIFLGLALGVINVFWEHPLLKQACIMTLVLNVFNLLPVLPFDGGWVAHVTLFSRSAVLDMLFRVVTVVLLFLISIALGARILVYVSIGIAVGLPAVWKIMRIRDMFQNDPLPPPVDDVIPAAAIRQIAAKIQGSSIPAANVQQLAQATIQVYEGHIIKPPSWPATFGIWTLHGGSVMAAVIGGALLVAVHAIKDDFKDTFAEMQSLNYQTMNVAFQFEETQFHLSEAGAGKSSDLLFWEYETAEAAKQAFEMIKEKKDQSCARMGAIVFASQAGVDEKQAKEIAEQSSSGNFREASLAMEKIATGNAALDLGIDGIQRKRLFSTQLYLSGLPTLLAEFPDTTQSQAAQQALRIMPIIRDRFSIPPWAPRTQLNAEQIRCRRLLAILESRTEPLPWLGNDKLPPLEFPEGPYSQARMRQYRENVEKRQRQIEKQRQEWIQMAAERATGRAAELLSARVNFEQQQKEYQAKLIAMRGNVTDAQLNSPDWAEQLKPFCDCLGYLEPTAVDYPFAAHCGVDYHLESDQNSEKEDSEELVISKVLSITLQSAPDSAAAMAGIMAWLRKQGCTSIKWQFQTLGSVE